MRSSHSRVLEGVAKSQFHLKAVVFKSRDPLRRGFKNSTRSCTLAWSFCLLEQKLPLVDGDVAAGSDSLGDVLVGALSGAHHVGSVVGG